MNTNCAPLLADQLHYTASALEKKNQTILAVAFNWAYMYICSYMLMILFYSKNFQSYICLFTVLRPTEEFFVYMETSPLPVKFGAQFSFTIASEDIGLCSALRAFKQTGILIVLHLL
jgi:hypothetical protein